MIVQNFLQNKITDFLHIKLHMTFKISIELGKISFQPVPFMCECFIKCILSAFKYHFLSFVVGVQVFKHFLIRKPNISHYMLMPLHGDDAHIVCQG